MREIKFRAWLKEHKSMIDVMEIDIDNQTIFYYWFGDHDGRFENFNKIDLMQYTGLEDKNNKEIYEGDIIKFLNSIFEVIWCNEKASFMLKNKEYKEFLNFIYENNNGMEIVGNIYQNLELYEEVK